MKKKIVHVLGKLDRGGIETWLKDVVIDDESNEIDFVLTKKGAGAYDQIVKEHSSNLYSLPLQEGIIKFTSRFYKLLKREKFDVVHAHPHFFSGYIAFIAFIAGVPIRVSHSHNDTTVKEKNTSLIRKSYLAICRMLIKIFSSRLVACSDEAGKSLFGSNTNFEIIHCGIDLKRFYKQGDEDTVKSNFKKSYNIPENASLVGHVGRFNEQKNHDLIIDIFSEICKKRDDVYLILVGVGDLKEVISDKVNKLNLTEQVIFLGGRDDINILMRAIFDLFLFPSLYEGLGIVLIEAQASGLKCLISDTIPREVIVITELVKIVSLKDSLSEWSENLLILLENQQITDLDIEQIMNNSSFNIQESVNALNRIYGI